MREVSGGSVMLIRQKYFFHTKNICIFQGPLPRTFSDTWQLVWEQRVVVIVMTTRTVERTRTKCGQYWPELEGEYMELTRRK